MRLLRATVVALAAAAALSLAVAVALAAPGALSPSRSAAAGAYCAPGVKEQRQRTARDLGAEVRRARRNLARFRAAQLRARASYRRQLGRDAGLTASRRAALFRAFVRKQNAQHRTQVRALNALALQLRRAQAQLARCD